MDEIIIQNGNQQSNNLIMKGVDLLKEKYVAIKTFSKMGMKECQIEAAREEVQIMLVLKDHTNIVCIIDSYEDDYCIYLVMDMV